MNINLSKIPEIGLNVDENIVLNKELYEKTEIEEIKNLHIKGSIRYDYEGNLNLNLEAQGIFILPDALTLEPIDYPFTSQIDEKIENIEEYCGSFYEKSKNSLDISEILWENIVLEIPISITNHKSEDLLLKGNGWELVNENKEEIDPRLAKLKELLDEGKE
ncbi:MAG: DUF177 domain-containing protein [Bacilli bacterium]|mgnify:CR=1 FL=1|nr:DUF177 domain-containing protein [Bacilli bacterium]